jgi:hypothetical protein
MPSSTSEPRNPFYFLLLATSLLFVVTVLGYLFIPMLEDKARAAGEPSPPSAFRSALRSDGWLWLLYELAAMIVFGLASMGLDRWRRLQNERASATIPPKPEGESSRIRDPTP